MSNDTASDEVVAQLVQQGDTQLFGVLVERYEPKLLRYAGRFLFGTDDAKDLVQDVFIRTYVNIKSFDVSRKFSSWIYRIAHNVFINALKKKGKEPVPFFDPDMLFPHPISAETADRGVNERELREAMDLCLKMLIPKYREVLALYYYEEMDYRDIAEVLRIPVSTVGVRLRRARIALKKALQQNKCI